MTKRKALGRGLNALFGDDTEKNLSTGQTPQQGASQQRRLPISALKPSKAQPRRYFNEESIEQLAHSIREHGILQPILVRLKENSETEYEIIAGERRWRAAAKAQLHEIPVIIETLTDLQALEIALVENLQRQDLTPIEEAEGYKRLIEEFGHTQEQLAKAIGKSRPAIANALRLLNLPEKIRNYVHEGQLTAGHARALLSADNPEALAQTIINTQMNVRDLEKLVSQNSGKDKQTKKIKIMVSKDPNIASLEKDLTNRLGLKVTIEHEKKGTGSLILHYKSLDQLDEVLHQLTHGQKRT